MAFRNTREQVATADNAGGHIAIRVSARARRIALRIDAAERKVELVLPSGVPTSDGLRFADSDAV